MTDEISFDDFLAAEMADTGKPKSLASHIDIPRGAANLMQASGVAEPVDRLGEGRIMDFGQGLGRFTDERRHILLSQRIHTARTSLCRIGAVYAARRAPGSGLENSIS